MNFTALLFYRLSKVAAEHVNPAVSGVQEIGFNRPGKERRLDDLTQVSHFYFFINDCPVYPGFSPIAVYLVTGYFQELFRVRLKENII